MSCVRFLDPIFRVIGGSEPAFLDMMAYFMLICGFLVPVITSTGLRIPYGRYSSPKWGWGLESRTAWFIQELPAFAVPVLLIVYCFSQNSSTLPNAILVGYFLVHYFQRTFIFSLLIRGGKETPLIPFLLAAIFCTYNGFMQARYLTHYAVYSQDWMKDPRFIIGSLLFMLGMAINIHSDYILRNLRKPGETGYKIPCGGMFDYVSGANFFGEIVEWIGFGVACWSLQSLAFASFTFCVIAPRALQHHVYYQEKFEDYPKSRKAVIPFVL